MTISIWRVSHFTLAISSALFILTASLTGVILVFEPISEKLNPYNVVDIENVTIAETIAVLNTEYDEIVTLKIDENDFISADVITKSGESDQFYINPKTGKKIGEIINKKPLFEFATNLHRSLFLKSTGRFIIGFVSFLLCLISITGIVLIAKRQGGFSKIFSKIVKENFNQYYHIIIGRYALIPILIICISGVYLSLERFSLLSKNTNSHEFTTINENESKTELTSFEIFKNTKLSEIKSIEFPFSDDEEDYYFVKFDNKELAIHQYNGQVISEKKAGIVNLLSHYSIILHTGKGSIIWSIILLFSCFALLFFIYTGFAMTLKRRKNSTSIKNKFKKEKAEYLILFGSETGNTLTFANLFYDALLKADKKVFIDELNNYSVYQKAKHLIVFTATYGEGEAPINANKFIKLIHQIQQPNNMKYSVLGFGSKAYPDFCKYAILVDGTLAIHKNFIPIIPLFKVDNESISEYRKWINLWSDNYNIPLKINEDIIDENKSKEVEFEVIDKSDLNSDETFLMKLKSAKKLKFTSGDLLEIKPKYENRTRLYSVGKIDKSILLSVRKHEFGKCSTFLNDLKIGNQLQASIQKNENFHFPKKTKSAILIANGTGIAPFLGMINKHKKATKVHLFWGIRTEKSVEIYQKYFDSFIKKNVLSSVHFAFSREQEKKIYVQDLLLKQEQLVLETLKNEDAIMICGSLTMQKSVLETLEKIVQKTWQINLKEFIEKGQIKMDCY